jgi:hypothetical protein
VIKQGKESNSSTSCLDPLAKPCILPRWEGDHSSTKKPVLFLESSAQRGPLGHLTTRKGPSFVVTGLLKDSDLSCRQGAHPVN